MNYGDEPSFAEMIAADRFAAVKASALQDRSASATRELLALSFPKCFAAKGAKKWPIKVGIDRDIKAALPELSRKQIKRALADYCGGPTYHRAILTRCGRVDLAGKYAGIVREQDVTFAQTRLDQMAARREKKTATQ